MSRRKPYAQLEVHDYLFTPVTPELLAFLERLKDEWGSWQKLGMSSRVSQRWLRKVLNGHYKAMAYVTLDTMLTNLGVVGEVQKFPWYTASELVEMGVWKEQPQPPKKAKGELTLAVERIRARRAREEEKDG
jgi:hypothetical protein